MKKFSWWQILCGLALSISLILGTLHLFRADTFYETDIARDFLLLDDMVTERKISLIGGRSSIPGVFHGPLYYWLVLPFFALSGGNPAAVSIAWLLLYWLFLGSFYYVAKKTFKDKFALIATTFIASLTTFTPAGFTHTVIANFLILPFIYLIYLYLKENKLWQLLAIVFTAGLLIQFQMAFGVPMLILFGTYIIYHIIKKKKCTHLLAGLVILIPLSTFLMFDLRHDFIQVKSVFAYLSDEKAGGSINGYFNDRVVSITDSFNVLNLPIEKIRNMISGLVIISLLFLIKKNYQSKEKNKTMISLATMVIFGFWIVTAPFQGNVWPQYYRPLLPVIVFCLTFILLNLVPKKIGAIILILFISNNLFFATKSGIAYMQSSPTADEIHWKFYRQMIDDIVVDNNKQAFGFFAFSPDQYGYQAKYALRYFPKQKNIETASFTKLPVTYLIIAPNDHKNPWANEDYWQSKQVKIDRLPDETWTYATATANSYTIRKFFLSETELKIEADPYLLDGIHFR